MIKYFHKCDFCNKEMQDPENEYLCDFCEGFTICDKCDEFFSIYETGEIMNKHTKAEHSSVDLV